ncbi:MAG: cytochrome c biogenesis CcdA family protein [Cellulomonas sp.]
MEPAALALALVAGAVAAFNPCGFALLPAYLTLLVAAPGQDPGRRAVTTRAVRFTAGMTTGFVAVFGSFALIVAPFALSVERWLPVLTVVIGVVLVGLGVWLLTGHTVAGPQLHRRGKAPGVTWVSQIGYGVTFALASLSCTIAPFLAATTSAVRTGSLVGVVAVFLAYAAGMGAVVGVLALATASAGSTLTVRLRRAAPTISRLSGVLLLVAGAYVAWYGWFELRVLAGARVDDPVVSAAIGVQAAISRAVAGLGAPGILAGAVVVLAIVVAAAARSAAHRRGAARQSAPQVSP